jgi:hypothetical protein
MNVEIGTEAAQFLFWEYINSNFFAVRLVPASKRQPCYTTAAQIAKNSFAEIRFAVFSFCQNFIEKRHLIPVFKEG